MCAKERLQTATIEHDNVLLLRAQRLTANGYMALYFGNLPATPAT